MAVKLFYTDPDKRIAFFDSIGKNPEHKGVVSTYFMGSRWGFDHAHFLGPNTGWVLTDEAEYSLRSKRLTSIFQSPFGNEGDTLHFVEPVWTALCNASETLPFEGAPDKSRLILGPVVGGEKFNRKCAWTEDAPMPQIEMSKPTLTVSNIPEWAHTVIARVEISLLESDGGKPGSDPYYWKAVLALQERRGV